MTVSVDAPIDFKTMVFLRHGDQNEGQDVVAVFRERHNFEPDQTIKLQPDPAHAHLFNAENGNRL